MKRRAAAHTRAVCYYARTMIIGVPGEIKRHEYRVGLTPHCAKTYVSHGHSVVLERAAGDGSGYTDTVYGLAVSGIDLSPFAPLDVTGQKSGR